MNKWINIAKLFLAFGFILTTLNCGLLPKSECELTESDGKNILGLNITKINKSDPVFGGAATQNNKNLRACGYVSEKPTEGSYLYWLEAKADDEENAKNLYQVSADSYSSDKNNFKVEELPRLGDEARSIEYKTEKSNNFEIAVRKGKSVFLITISKPSSSEIPIAAAMSLAERIAD